MKDLTKYFLDAINSNLYWKHDMFFDAVNLLQLNKYTISFWLNEENWAIINLEDKTIGYMWINYPLLFVLNEYIADILTLLDSSQITIVGIKSLQKKEFKVDYNLLKDYLDYGFDSKCFSIEDLWFYTNSI
ncbi:hypothetical protein O2K51_11995 [Apibacter raozihei]|uniref:hypothetical protein n=1 Tax=Apibacter raozihei TaxID=2500547 RepID=UPI000FE2C907|nr:hypothetical protein [Apibacter raozihei]